MLDHFGVKVPDLVAAKQYYDQVMPLLEFESFFATGEQFSYQPMGGGPGVRVFFYPTATPAHVDLTAAGVNHLAFYLRSREAVRAVHTKVVGLGSDVLHEPRTFPEYHAQYYATFWYDPFGFLLETVCHKDTDANSADLDVAPAVVVD